VTDLGNLERGDFFGERSLLKDEPRAATVKAIEDVECLILERKSFSLLMGPLEDLMRRKIDEYDGIGSEPAKASALSPFLDIKFEDLILMGTLGRGSFGHVQLAKDRKSGKTFALKEVRKAQIVHLGQQEHIMSEKKVMASLNHPFLINLRQTFKDEESLFFLLELCLGGELFTVLRARTAFDEKTARFYAGCVILAFEHMHDHDIIYRDLKPENLMVNDDGYLKVTDFGFAKVVPDRTWTLCGTPDYLAPEVVSGQGHGKGVDWWTLGILIYEMLASYPPFYDDDPMRTYSKIMYGSVNYPKHFSKEAVNLIQKLLHPKATKRLGVLKGGATLIKEHPWFRGFDWDALYNRKLKAPIIPKISSPEDMSNFDEYPDEEEEEFPPYEDDGSNWDADF
jgi:cGMP-dependent protein kinase